MISPAVLTFNYLWDTLPYSPSPDITDTEYVMGKLFIRSALIPLVLSTVPFAAAQLVTVPGHTSVSTNTPAIVTIDDVSGAHVMFKYTGVDSAPNFIVVIPSSGTTPARIQIGVNPNVAGLLKPGSRWLLTARFSTVGQDPPSTAAMAVDFTVDSTLFQPIIQSAVNSASLQPALSPGVLVSIFGSYLSGTTLSTTFDDTASYPTSAAGTSVTFNDVEAPLVFVSPTQINAIVPFSLTGQNSAHVAVQRWEQVSAPVTVPLRDTAPAIFTSTQTGTGQAAILQQAGQGPLSYNSSSNPARAGDFLEIFATGQGLWAPPPQSDVFFFGEPFTTLPVSLTIGGEPTKIVYAGTLGARLSSWSVLQINAVVPDGLSPGDEPLVLKIGANDNTAQKVTIAVQ